MNFPNAVKSGFRNYANFKGRATRSEFWWFALFSQLLQTLIQGVSASIASIASLVLFLPNLSLHVRRLHDIGRSAKWIIWLAASIAGMVIAFVGLLMQTTQTIANLDVGQLFDNGSQFWIIVMFVFFISALCSLVVNFVFTLIPSDKEMNKYGPPPPPPTL
jgi:uncharacterized membrane protein YhaH (DUF805 family)